MKTQQKLKQDNPPYKQTRTYTACVDVAVEIATLTRTSVGMILPVLIFTNKHYESNY